MLLRATLLFLSLSCLASRVSAEDRPDGIFADRNLVAWCIVPFDAKNRTPQQRAEMLVRLGISRVAYDWREKHIPEFEEEILQYRKNKLEYFAFWSWHDSMEPLIRKYDIHPQIWMMMRNSTKETQDARVQDAAEGLLPMVKKTQSLGCKLGIYNHGGWAGEPDNMIAVTEYLHAHHDAKHVGIVYNFHHGHDHIGEFRTHIGKMAPFLHCLNIDGMDDATAVAADGGRKILPLGSGKHELRMLKIVKDSDYKGAVGILDHRSELDAEESLKSNIDGLHTLLRNGL